VMSEPALTGFGSTHVWTTEGRPRSGCRPLPRRIRNWREDAELTHIGVQCWVGNLDERPEDADGDFDDDVDRAFSDYTSIDTDQPTSVHQTVNVEGYSGYACEWAYETSDDIGEDDDAMARGESEDVIALHQSQYSSEWDAVADRFDLDDREFPENW